MFRDGTLQDLKTQFSGNSTEKKLDAPTP